MEIYKSQFYGNLKNPSVGKIGKSVKKLNEKAIY